MYISVLSIVILDYPVPSSLLDGGLRTVRAPEGGYRENDLNSVQGIGGFAARAIKKEKDEDQRRPMQFIMNEAKRIEAVVKALQSLESVSTERYTESSETLMIDIRKELQEKIEALGREKDQPH